MIEVCQLSLIQSINQSPHNQRLPYFWPIDFENTIFQGISHSKETLQGARGENRSKHNPNARGHKKGELEGKQHEQGSKVMQKGKDNGTCKWFIRLKEKSQTIERLLSLPINAVVEPAQNAINRCQDEKKQKKKKQNKNKTPSPFHPVSPILSFIIHGQTNRRFSHQRQRPTQRTPGLMHIVERTIII